MVFFMQPGFAMVETGFTRAKNAGNIIMKNLLDLSIGAPVYWLVGFGIMFGTNNGWIGTIDFLTRGDYSAICPEGVPFYAWFIFQTVFCATSATIVSGAMAERTKFSSYCVYSLAISLLVYPVSGHWIWGGGWLSELGFHDFAGSTAVHMVGGVCALIGAKILGPRIGKYNEDGSSNAILGHSLTLGALGVFILWFCWFGFNGCSTVSMEGDAMYFAGKIFVTTNLAAAVGTITTMIFTWIRYKKPDISMTLNGTLAGLVGVTAGCDTVTPVGAAVIGIVSGIVVVLVIEFIDQKLHIDDPVGAVGVHGACGALGTILVGLLSDGEGTDTKGLFYGGGTSLLGVQCLGVICVIIWVAVVMTIIFLLIKHTMGLRVSRHEEIQGLDSTEHGIASSYADFMPYGPQVLTTSEKDDAKEPVPVEYVSSPYVKKGEKDKLSKVVVITRGSVLDELKRALDAIGITGLTVTHVMGYGMEGGALNYYRGAKIDTRLLPKIKLEIVLGSLPVEDVVETIKKTIYTGHVGDGKIFIYDVENVIKVRTGEYGIAALQDKD